MERLTKKDPCGLWITTECEEHYDEQPNGTCKVFCMGEAIDRLAAYEDTGLTPEEVGKLKTEIEDLRREVDGILADQKFVKMLKENGADVDAGIRHMEELIEAEKDGRLVVLDEEMTLAMYAGARSILNNKRLQGVTYVYDCFGELDGPKEISYFQAAKVLRRIGDQVLTRQETEEAVREEGENA